MNILPLASLHKHFLAADAVKQLLFTTIPVDASTSTLSPERQEVAQQFSSMLRLQVFYELFADICVPWLCQSDFGGIAEDWTSFPGLCLCLCGLAPPMTS